MTTFTTRASLRKPELSDSPANIQSALGNAVDDIDKVCVPIYPSTSFRGAVDPSPTVGLCCYITASGTGGRTFQSYNGTAWGSNFFGTRFVQKSSTTARASTITITNDPHLTMTVEANATYEFNFVLFISGDPAADVRLGLTHPTGTTYRWGQIAPSQIWGAGTGDGVLTSSGQIGSGSSSGPTFTGVTATGTPLLHGLRGTVATSSTSGSLTLQWAQVTSNVNATEIRQGSYLVMTRIA